MNRLLSLSLYLLAAGIGLASFFYPFFMPALQQRDPTQQIRAGEMPLMIMLLLGVCLVVVLFEIQSQAVDAKLIAMLGMLVAINSLLRFIEVAIPAPGGFSPIFFLIVMVGYVFGGRLGFVMGALTLLTSALITGGVGPWLPSQMFVAGWVGMSAALVRFPLRMLRIENLLVEVIVLGLFGAFSGFGYGILMNLWSWPFIAGPAEQYWNAGISVRETFQRYGVYYLVTSLVWDSSRALGNLFLVLAAGAPTLRALRRFQRRFSFTYTPAADQQHRETSP